MKVKIFSRSPKTRGLSSSAVDSVFAGLFSRAISQSGSVYLGGSLETAPVDSVRQLGEKLNCSNVDGTHELHQCLIHADPKDIAMKFSEILDFSYLSKEYIPEDGDISEVFFEDYPITLSEAGARQNAPWLAGNNNAESFPTAHSTFLGQNINTSGTFSTNF